MARLYAPADAEEVINGLRRCPLWGVEKRCYSLAFRRGQALCKEEVGEVKSPKSVAFIDVWQRSPPKKFLENRKLRGGY